MPILPAEPSCFPEHLFDCVDDLPNQGDRYWRVLHTKPRQEKSLARQLRQGQVPFFLPLISRRSLIRGRLLTSYIPLFAGYCFLLADEKERVKALATHRVVNALDVPDQKELWHDLRQIRRLIESGVPITPEGQLVAGTLVEIRSGPLAGLSGVIVRQANQRRFVVQVDFIHRGASVEVDDYMLAKAE
jgi:transcriptional antiterminator RfaH